MTLRVSVQQAAANAFAAWLQDQMPDVPVSARWPAADRAKPPVSISVITAGRRIDQPLDPHVLSMTNKGTAQVQATWQVAACTQPFQLDIWANTDPARDDIIARLDEFLHKGESSLEGAFATTPFGTGNLIAVKDGWEDFGTIADFVFEEPDLETTADAVARSIYRATYRGNAYFMLALSATTSRQKIINFNLRLQEPDGTLSVVPVPPITS